MSTHATLDESSRTTSIALKEASSRTRQKEPLRHRRRETNRHDAASGKKSDQSEPAQHIAVLDAWRGAAVVLLMIGHFFPIYRLDCGAFGVELFFVLSGFLMGRILFLKQTPLKAFYQRRISRIFPAAYAFLFAMLGWQWIAGTDAGPSFAATASCFLFFSNYVVAINPHADLGIPAGHFWSLCVEEHSYIYLSLLSVLHRRLGIKPLWLIGSSIAFCCVSAFIAGGSFNGDPYQVYWRTDCRAASIFFGAAAACLAGKGFGSKENYLKIPAIAWGSLAVCFGAFFRLQFMPEFLKHSLATALLATGLLLIAKHGKGNYWSCPPLVWIGTISFSLYLWQQPFYIAVHNGHLHPGFAVLGALAAGVLSYWLIEKPARSWINRKLA